MSAGSRTPALLLCALALVFVALGVWQIRRLAWKTALIAQTEAAVHATPIDPAALPPQQIAGLVYRRVAMTGHFVARGTTLVTGTSGIGTGYWDLVPLADGHGHVIMVNRGFLPQGSKVDAARRGVPTGTVRVEGLLRLTEPGGTWLRANRPDQDRWYARDVVAIAAKRGVRVTDPRLFVDSWAEMPAPPVGGPVPGLTVIAFANNHLGYALTWFAMALMASGGAVVLLRRP